jgi:hypothetical protein
MDVAALRTAQIISAKPLMLAPEAFAGLRM